MQIFDYIKASKFFPRFAPTVTSWKKKIVGKNTNGNPVSFTEEEKAKIKEGLLKIIDSF